MGDYFNAIAVCSPSCAGGVARRILAATTSACYAINGPFYDRLLENYQDAEAKLKVCHSCPTCGARADDKADAIWRCWLLCGKKGKFEKLRDEYIAGKSR